MDYYDLEEDARRDDFYDGLRVELTDEIIGGFKSELLVFFYKNNPNIAEKPYRALSEAQCLFNEAHYTSAQLHAFICIEVAIKSVLVEPIVKGYIHTESIAKVIVDMIRTIAMGRFDNTKKILKVILYEVAGIDLATYSRAGETKLFWDEICSVKDRRNLIIHGAEEATKAEAEFAIQIASEIFSVVLPRFVQNLSFHLHEGYKICDQQSCSPEWLAMCEKIGLDPKTNKSVKNDKT